MNIKRYLRLLVISLLLALSPSVVAHASCIPDSLAINGGGGFGDDDQKNPGLGSNSAGSGFSDGDQSNPTMGSQTDNGFSDGEMAGGSTNQSGGSSGGSTVAKNVIIYITSDGKVITLSTTEGFGVSYQSNTYADGQGKITFGGDVTTVPESAFEENKNLVSVKLPEGLTGIENFAFSGCTALSNIVLSSTLESLGRYVFDECEALTDVTCYAQTPPTLKSNTFAVYGTLHVLTGCKAAYETANYWKNFNIVEDAEDPNLYKFKDGEAYSSSKDVTIEKFAYIRTFNNDKWQALYVPFSIPVDTLTKYGLQVAELNDTHMYYDDETGDLKDVTVEFYKKTSGSTKANYPYLIRATETGEKNFTLKNVELKAAAETSIDCSTIYQKFTFTGTYSGVSGEDMYSNHYYAMSGGALSRVSSSSVSLKPQRWYMKIENRDGSAVSYYAPRMRLVVDDIYQEETSLENVANPSTLVSLTFDMQGRKVNENTKLTPGIYMRGGKKIIIK